MAYRLYAASPADYFIDGAGAPKPGQVATVWTAESGGTPIDDLLAEDGTPQTTVIADSLGGFRFQAQDTLPSDLWVDAGGPDRYVVHATLIGTRLDALETTVAAFGDVPVDPVTDAEMTAAISAAVATEATNRNVALGNHNDDEDAHPAKVSAMNGLIRVWKAGNVPSVGSVAMPTPADGLLPDDLVVNYG